MFGQVCRLKRRRATRLNEGEAQRVVMSERPRRTARPANKQPILLAETSKSAAGSGQSESKKNPKQSEKLFDIEYLLTDPKSQLTRLDISVSLVIPLSPVYLAEFGTENHKL